jgi:hypothetical protein
VVLKIGLFARIAISHIWKSSYTENPHFRHTLKNGYIKNNYYLKKTRIFTKWCFLYIYVFLVIVKKV